jgi:hypothetical protein
VWSRAPVREGRTSSRSGSRERELEADGGRVARGSSA